MLATTNRAFVPLLLATGVASAAWMLLLVGWFVYTRSRHVEPGPAAMLDLEHEALSPAVVNLLVNQWHVENEAIAATLVDLAARGFLSIEQFGPRQEMCRLTPGADTSQLLPHERWVLSRVEGSASGGTVPLAALNSEPERVEAWRKRFAEQVIDEADRLGLSRPRLSTKAKALLIVAALVPAALAFAAAEAAPVAAHTHGTTDASQSGGAAAGSILATVIVVLVAVLPRMSGGFGGQTSTPNGVDAAAKWLGFRNYLLRDKVFPTLSPGAVAVWSRNLSYGLAVGAAAAAAHALPFGPEPDRQAWSQVTGQWRIVRVSYPRRLLWGSSPWRSVWRGVLLLGVAAAVVYGYEYAHQHAAQFTHKNISQGLAIASVVIFAFVVPIFGLLGLTYLWRGAADLFSASEIKGPVVRRRQHRSRRPWTSSTTAYRRYVAVDDGSHRRIRAYCVDIASYGRLAEGMSVRLTATKHLGYVSSLFVEDVPLTAVAPLPSASSPVPAATTARVIGSALASSEAAPFYPSPPGQIGPSTVT